MARLSDLEGLLLKSGSEIVIYQHGDFQYLCILEEAKLVHGPNLVQSHETSTINLTKVLHSSITFPTKKTIVTVLLLPRQLRVPKHSCQGPAA